MRMKGNKKYLAILSVAFALCAVTWILALWLTGARLDYRNDTNSGLVALYLAPEAGVSLQWSEQGYGRRKVTGDCGRKNDPAFLIYRL